MFRNLIVASLIAGTAWLSGTAMAQSQSGARFHYQGEMQIWPEAGELALDWQISVFESELDQVSFMLSPAFDNVDIHGADVRAVEISTMDGFSGPISVYTVSLAEGRPVREIAVSYSGLLLPEPLQHEINTVDSEKVELTVDSFWMPFDQRFSSLVTADLAIRLPGYEAGDWAGVSMQDIQPVDGGFRLRQTRPALDVAFTLMSDFHLVEADAYSIYDLRGGAAADLSGLIGALQFCTGYLNRLSGPAGPLPQARIIITRREAAGYSRGTLIALTDIAGSEPDRLTQFICHELAHHWSYGNAMTVENWLNESFADYIAVMGMREVYGEGAFEDRLESYRQQIASADLPAIWTSSMTARPPYLIAYRKGPLALARLEAEIGREAFASFLRAAMVARISTTRQMLDLLEAEAGRSARENFEAVLAEEG